MSNAVCVYVNPVALYLET